MVHFPKLQVRTTTQCCRAQPVTQTHLRQRFVEEPIQAVHVGAAAAEQSYENFRFFEAPHVAVLTTEERLGVYGLLDCGLYLQSFMLAARDAGVDTIAQAALAGYSPFIRDHFAIDASRRIVCGISFGYAEADHPINGYRTERAATASVVRFVND